MDLETSMTQQKTNNILAIKLCESWDCSTVAGGDLLPHQLEPMLMLQKTEKPDSKHNQRLFYKLQWGMTDLASVCKHLSQEHKIINKLLFSFSLVVTLFMETWKICSKEQIVSSVIYIIAWISGPGRF